MSLTCNIDARGKAVRLRIGIGGLVVGIAMLIGWALPIGGTLPWVITAAVLLCAAGFHLRGTRGLVRRARHGFSHAI